MKPDFDRIVEENFAKVFNLLHRLSGDYHVAQDLCQDVFLNAFRHYPQFRMESDAYTWLYRIALNRFYRHYRTSRLRSWLGLDQVAPEEMAHCPEEEAEKDQERKVVARAVAELPLDFRAAIVLYYFENMDCQSIARILNCSVGTVKSRLWRGRQLLARKLGPEPKEKGASHEVS